MRRTTSRVANDAWEAMLTAHATLIRELGSQDVWQGLTMREYDVVYALSKCQGPLRLGELNHYVLLSQPALSRLVDRLVSRGLVQRSVAPADGRGVLISLTDYGRAEQRRLGGRHALGVARVVTARLSRQELEQLEQLCAKLSDLPPVCPGRLTDRGRRSTEDPTGDRTTRRGPTTRGESQ